MSGFLEVAFGFGDRRQIELGQGVVGGSEQGRLGGCAGPSDVAAGEESSREQVGHVDVGATMWLSMFMTESQDQPRSAR